MRVAHGDWIRDVAKSCSLLSLDPSTKVGAVIYDSRYRILGTGYNGFPSGIDDSDLALYERPLKYGLIIHAEMNALLNSHIHGVWGAFIYSTHKPCCNCLKHLIQAGVRNISWTIDYQDSDPIAQSKLLSICNLVHA